MHCVRVLRKRAGDKIFVIDGKGSLFAATIEHADKKACLAKITELIKQDESRPYYLHIAIAPTKNISRFEWFLEKATEIGIDEITPILCEHSERKTIRPDRLEKILLSAAKQSLKAALPKLNDLIPIADFVKAEQPDVEKYMGWCEEETTKLLKNQYQAGKNACILIGPEGGFSPREVDMAQDNGFQTISFGESRLRTETAGLAACFTINLLN